MVLELVTVTDREDANRRWYNQQTIQREVQNPRANHLSFEVYKKSKEEKNELRVAIAHYKAAMEAYYGKNWKKSGYMNVPISFVF